MLLGFVGACVHRRCAEGEIAISVPSCQGNFVWRKRWSLSSVEEEQAKPERDLT